MAKLEGVKTLDMVNGEITKVAYDGAEYERVEGEGKVGDLVLIKHGWTYATKGEFYESVGQDSDRDAKIIDDDGEENSNYRTTYELFRKVAASTNPSVEERVAKAEGEIESLKSDVAALKGEAEYKRIVKSEARAGDFVKFTNSNRCVTDKDYYEIEEFDCVDPVITDDDGDRYDTCGDDFEVYRKVDGAPEPKPERLKVGDYARVVKNISVNCAEVGEIVVVKVVDGNGAPYKCEKLNGERSGWFYGFELVRATDEEVAEAKRTAEFAKFKEGVKVRLKSGGGDFPLNGFENGKIYEVEDEGYPHIAGEYVRIIGGDAFQGFATPDQLEILSEEEAAEHKKWAEIGREVGEYKVGDIFRSPGGNLFEITRIDDSCSFPIRFTNLKGDDDGYKRDAAITLITPVEARFDR